MAQYGPVRLYPQAVVSSDGAGGANNCLVADGNTTDLDKAGDRVRVGQYSPAGLQGDEIVSIKIGFSANSDAGVGLSPSQTLRYFLGGIQGATESTFDVTLNAASFEDYPDPLLDITADRAWVFNDLSNLDTETTRNSPDGGFRDTDIDVMFIEVVTQDTPTPEGLNELHQVTLGVTPVQLVPNPIVGDLGPVYLVLKCNEDNTDLVNISHQEVPDTPDDIFTVEPGQPLIPLNFISTATEPVEIWAQGATPGQKIQYGIFVDSGVVLQQQANGLLTGILDALLGPIV